MKDTLKKAKKVEKEITNGIKGVFMLVNGRIIKFMAMEDTIGLMEGYVDR